MTALEELAERCGIEASYVDARGETRQLEPATRARVFEALGLKATDEAAARDVLEDLDRAEWRRGLPPVIVVPEGRPIEISLTLKAGAAACSWTLVLEDGTRRSGAIAVASLRLTEAGDAMGAGAGMDAGTGQAERRRWQLEDGLPAGYHRLTVAGDVIGNTASTHVIVTPVACWLPPSLVAGGRIWGVAAQLYLLRSARDWGIGDFGDLRAFVDLLAQRGADVVGVNPLHALFPDQPERASPYSPNSRLLLNVLYIDIPALPEYAECAAAQALVGGQEFRAALAACHAAPQVDYTAVAQLKLPVLSRLHAAARAQRRSRRWREFQAFRRARGVALERACVFDVLRQHWMAESPRGADWRTWPAEFRDPDSAAVRAFARAHEEAVSFRCWLEYCADAQLESAAQAARGMAVGLYRDLAVGADATGAEGWVNQRAVVAGVTIGAPPDIYNPGGQDWGLPPFDPRALREEAYASWIELLRANMRHAGGLRIDHVMGLRQLYWVPAGCEPAAGAYVRYPFEDMLGILALESRRHRCLVVGEDLGTVPQGFRERMTAAGVLSYRVVLFERDAAGYLPPERYPPLSLAVSGSHDLPTLSAWWDGSDLRLKDSLKLFPAPADRERALEERDRDRRDLLSAFAAAGIAAPPADVGADVHGGTEAFRAAAHAFLARSRSAIALLQIDELTGEQRPVNVPTTSDQYPNWRRRQSATLEEIEVSPTLTDEVERLRALRRSGVHVADENPVRRRRGGRGPD